MRRKVNISVNNEEWSAQSPRGSLSGVYTVRGPGNKCAPYLFMICDPFLIWSANSWLRQINPGQARQRRFQTSPTTCQSLISSQDCNIRDVSLWLLREGPIQLWFCRLIESDRLGLLMQILICLKNVTTTSTSAKNQLGLGSVLGVWSAPNVSSSSFAWLALLYFPIGVSEWENLLGRCN